MNIDRKISERLSELNRLNGTYSKREVRKVKLETVWNPFGNSSSQSLFSQGGGGRRLY